MITPQKQRLLRAMQQVKTDHTVGSKEAYQIVKSYAEAEQVLDFLQSVGCEIDSVERCIAQCEMVCDFLAGYIASRHGASMSHGPREDCEVKIWIEEFPCPFRADFLLPIQTACEIAHCVFDKEETDDESVVETRETLLPRMLGFVPPQTHREQVQIEKIDRLCRGLEQLETMHVLRFQGCLISLADAIRIAADIVVRYENQSSADDLSGSDEDLVCDISLLPLQGKSDEYDSVSEWIKFLRGCIVKRGLFVKTPVSSPYWLIERAEREMSLGRFEVQREIVSRVLRRELDLFKYKVSVDNVEDILDSIVDGTHEELERQLLVTHRSFARNFLLS